MSEPFLAEVRIISFNFAPKGWALCNGQLLPINQNQALFSLLGTTYGGDGRVNFALPDLRGRTPIHMGDGFIQGQRGGETSHTVNQSEMPQHTHMVYGTKNTPNSKEPQNKLWAPSTANPYSNALTNAGTMSPTSVTATGGSQPHENMQPYLALNFIIALQGIFPSQN